MTSPSKNLQRTFRKVLEIFQRTFRARVMHSVQTKQKVSLLPWWSKMKTQEAVNHRNDSKLRRINKWRLCLPLMLLILRSENIAKRSRKTCKALFKDISFHQGRTWICKSDKTWALLTLTGTTVTWIRKEMVHKWIMNLLNGTKFNGWSRRISRSTSSQIWKKR